ncbi:hypothetical protein HGRIS_005875 [Hohenbuehelia grisea]|uniref:Uncharacterized protein n=1 Tax=Hohenbuehelia grisea TaxID=104357 RepID=A0ABR3JY44_9AGAR
MTSRTEADITNKRDRLPPRESGGENKSTKESQPCLSFELRSPPIFLCLPARIPHIPFTNMRSSLGFLKNLRPAVVARALPGRRGADKSQPSSGALATSADRLATPPKPEASKSKPAGLFKRLTRSSFKSMEDAKSRSGSEVSVDSFSQVQAKYDAWTVVEAVDTMEAAAYDVVVDIKPEAEKAFGEVLDIKLDAIQQIDVVESVVGVKEVDTVGEFDWSDSSSAHSFDLHGFVMDIRREAEVDDAFDVRDLFLDARRETLYEVHAVLMVDCAVHAQEKHRQSVDACGFDDAESACNVEKVVFDANYVDAEGYSVAEEACVVSLRDVDASSDQSCVVDGEDSDVADVQKLVVGCTREARFGETIKTFVVAEQPMIRHGEAALCGIAFHKDLTTFFGPECLEVLSYKGEQLDFADVVHYRKDLAAFLGPECLQVYVPQSRACREKVGQLDSGRIYSKECIPYDVVDLTEVDEWGVMPDGLRGGRVRKNLKGVLGKEFRGRNCGLIPNPSVWRRLIRRVFRKRGAASSLPM